MERCIFDSKVTPPLCNWRNCREGVMFCWRSEVGCVYMSDEVVKLIRKMRSKLDEENPVRPQV